MLRRYAVAHAVYQPRQCDVVSLSLISNYQPFGYLHLVLRRSAGTQVKTHQRFWEAVKPLTHQISETSNRHRVVFQNHYPTGLAGSPLQRAVMIPVRAVILFIEEEMGANTHGQRFSLLPPGVMANNAELNICQHHYG